MANFTVTFQLKSVYQNHQFNRTALFEKDYTADSLDNLFGILDDTDEIDSISDVEVVSVECGDVPTEVNVEYVLIHDDTGKEIYRAEHYK